MPITTMTSRDRVLTTLHREPADRVPMDYMANPTIHGKVMHHFGLNSDDYVGLLRALHCDFLCAAPAYNGPRLHPEKPGVLVDPEYGIHTRWVENEFGGYTDFCEFPLAELDPDQLAAWPMPNPDHYDYDGMERFIRASGDFAFHLGGAGTADIINQTGMVAGMESTLAGLMTGDEALLNLIDRRLDAQLAVLERAYQRLKDQIAFVWLGEDLGTQRAPMISLDLYRKVLQPRHRRFFDFAKSHNLPIMVHTCGCSSWVYEEFINDGVAAVDTLQPEAHNMSPRYLKDTFGDRLAFHGCISTAGTLANGTPDEVRAEVRETLDIMMPGGGYCLSPTHMIQDNTPVENILALYETGIEYGRY